MHPNRSSQAARIQTLLASIFSSEMTSVFDLDLLFVKMKVKVKVTGMSQALLEECLEHCLRHCLEHYSPTLQQRLFEP